MRGMRGALAALAVAVGLGSAVWAVRWLAVDPVRLLPRVTEAVPLERMVQTKGGTAQRVRYQVQLDGGKLGPIGLAVDLPDPLPQTRLPIVVVLGGLGTGSENLRHIPDAGANAVIGYDWPVAGALPQGWALVAALPDLYRRMLAAPGQVAAGLGWVADQPWADRERISLLGFSLGTLAVPAIQRLMASANVQVGWTILAYGGAPIGSVLAAHPKLPARWLATPAAVAADVLFRPIEPLRHLPHLQGRFLVMGGTEDRLIPGLAAERLAAAVPAPKTVLRFSGDHMGVGADQQALLDRIVEASITWLVTSQAVNPRPDDNARRINLPMAIE